jgi:alkanesulfonate monooxygenase SsuD/methylene tetrahydromethanopterin reductase-like flavin-dependent oxidoreductase (luciferase family)
MTVKKPVRFGWRIPDFPVNDSRGKEFGEQVLRALDEVHEGFDSAWQADHFVPWARFAPPDADTLEAWTTIAYLAGRYTNLLFGNIVLCQSYRSPALLAKMAATFQLLSGGRLVLGIGAGWKEDEYLAYGYEYPSTQARLEQLEETVQILRKMWNEPRASLEGKHYYIREAICEPKPPLPIPLMVGGGGKKVTLRITAQYADWWNFPGCTPERYAELLAVLKKHCLEVGRDYEQIVKTWLSDCVAIAPTHEAALEIAQSSPFYDPETSIVGTPDEVARRLGQYVDLGVEHFILRFVDFPGTQGAKLFAQEVRPRFYQ